MTDENKPQASQGIGLPGALTILFVGLKLTHYIDWSWLYVISPILISVAVVGLVAGIAAAIKGAQR